MLVVDANDVRGSSMKRENLPSPVVHPAIEALWEGMASREDCRTDILFGRHCPAARVRPATGSLSFHEVPYRRLGGILPGAGFLGRMRSLLRALARIQPQLVHGQGSERESALAAVSSSYPGILTLHGLMGEVAAMPENRALFHYRIAGWIEKYALKKAQGTIAISSYALRIILGSTQLCRLIPNAVRGIFYQANATRRPAAPPRVLFAGNLTQVKRPEWFIRAVHLLWSRGLDFHARMLVMGDPGHPYYLEILEQAGSPVGGHNIEVKPNVSRVWEEMADADILFAPSNWESMGIAVCEAMATGLCVVASRIEANFPLLGQGCGVMFGSDSFEEATAALERAIRDPVFRQQTVEKAKKRVKQYHPSKVAEQTIGYYREILEGIN
jgi:glycosyltransferase involved in cell wall biosynthesis